MPVYEGYGLSMCVGGVPQYGRKRCRPGSVGRPLPHVEVRLADDGEVLIKGSTLLGYLGEAPHADEWWPSGDLGEFDEEGFLYLKGRKKHQFVTSFGRNVNPEWVEAELTSAPSYRPGLRLRRGAAAATMRCSGRTARTAPTSQPPP